MIIAFTCGVLSARVVQKESIDIRLIFHYYFNIFILIIFFVLLQAIVTSAFFIDIIILSAEVLNISNKELLINEEIREKELRVIGSDGSQLGIMSSSQAQKIAYEANLDLVMISPNAKPPVCKIMDYGKYRFEQARKEKEKKKNQKIVDIKEVRLSLNIDTHDFNTKLNHALKFIEKGDKVKVSIKFRGRELGHPELGLEIMNRFSEACAETASVEKPPKLEGRNMLMFLAPKPAK